MGNICTNAACFVDVNVKTFCRYYYIANMNTKREGEREREVGYLLRCCLGKWLQVGVFRTRFSLQRVKC